MPHDDPRESLPRPTPFDDHPSARAVRARPAPPPKRVLTHAEVRAIALEAGADDAAAVPLDHPDLSEERPFVLRALPSARSLIAIVGRMHVDDVRSPSRSVANLEFHRTGHEIDAIAQRIAVALSLRGHPTINPSMAFPMEMDAFPGRAWVVSHKKVAVAAQLGRMGIHRSVIHPTFGSFILLGTVVTSAEIEGAPLPLAFDPCLGCNLCIAACPVGAIERDGFRFSACYDHNYKEFMSGFADFAEEVADSKDRFELRDRVSQSETASLWQSLAYQPNYKAAYCLAVCPAGEDVLGPFLDKRAQHLKDVVKPLTDRKETIYVVAGSDAEAHVKKRFPHKATRVVRSSLRPSSAKSFFSAIPLTFQRGPAKGWKATFHFTLTGAEAVEATVRVDDGTLEVEQGIVGQADLTVQADGKVWLEIVEKRRSPVMAVLTGRLKTRGDRALLSRFAACFPR
jgi:putative sterol carrier protein/NAD-dependent dihydropyrimidine dehydrogenase PreA subunit